jgi:uncharacterized protein (TIGR03083 family)
VRERDATRIIWRVRTPAEPVATDSVDDITMIDLEGRRLLEFARKDPGAVVPQYPTWCLRDLVVHVAGIHGRTSALCRTLPAERIPVAELPPGRDPFDWYEEELMAMVDALRHADRTATVWTFVSDRTIAAWERRMVVETGIHRWDAQGAIARPDPLPTTVAQRGLDEFPEMWLPRLGDLPAVELVASDLGRSWRFGKGEPSTSVSATASELFLRLMSRPGARLPDVWEVAVDRLASAAG